MSIFGAIVTGRDVENAVEATLTLWLPTYLAEMERRTGRDPGSLPTIGYWTKANRFPAADRLQLPAGVIVSPGISDRPEADGGGVLSAWWRAGIAVVVGTGEPETTDELAKLYGAAVRTLLLQRGSLGGFANDLDLVAESYDDVPSDYLQVGAVVELQCDVLVHAITERFGGPAEPIPDPTVEPDDLVDVSEARITVTPRSLT